MILRLDDAKWSRVWQQVELPAEQDAFSRHHERPRVGEVERERLEQLDKGGEGEAAPIIIISSPPTSGTQSRLPPPSTASLSVTDPCN